MIKLVFKKIRSILLITMLLAPFFATKADIVDELGAQISDLQKKWQVLEDQRQEIIKSLKEKKAVTANLENQIALIDAEIKLTQTKIDHTEAKLAQTALEIKKFNDQITDKEKNIIRQKKIIGGLFREIFSSDDANILNTLLKNNSLSEFFDNSSALEEVQGKINVLLKDLKNSKETLEWERKQQISKKEEYNSLRAVLINETDELNSNVSSKKSLLVKTKGDQTRYENLLKRINEQRDNLLGNIEELEKQKAKELARVQSNQVLPPPNPVAGLWHYFQTDSRWSDNYIGFSNSTMKQYGCAIASLAMVFKYHNVDITPDKLARQPIFYYDLIKWPNTWRGLKLISNEARQKVDWKKVDANLKDGNPVIVFVRAVGKNGGHYVVIFAKDSRGYIVNDPMWGSNIYLDSTRENIATLYDTTTSVEQMILYK